MHHITDAVINLLEDNQKISILDCGAVGGMENDRWKKWPGKYRIFGFDADENAANQVNIQAKKKGFDQQCFPICLAGEDNQSKDFYLTKSHGCSSLYPPDENFIKRCKQFIGGKVQKSSNYFFDCQKMSVKTATLDTWAKTYGISDIDFMKLDIQGAELDVLKAANTLLPSTLAIEVEVEFVPIYHNQPLFADVDNFMRQNGFTFFNFAFTHGGHYVGRINSPVTDLYPGNDMLIKQSKGQLVTADAIYLRDPLNGQCAESLSIIKFLKLICIAEILEQTEFAFELLSSLAIWLENNGQTLHAGVLEDIAQQAADKYNQPNTQNQQIENTKRTLQPITV